MRPHLETLELEPEQTATAAVIWMHGLGADAHDFFSVPPQLGLPADLAVRFVFPNAPKIPITVNMGMVMRAWYDVSGFDRLNQDEQRIRQSADWIDELVSQELERGILADRIVLAGFSQGGAMALFAGLRQSTGLAGVMCLSGYLPLHDEVARATASGVQKPAVFQGHGTNDPLVPYEAGSESRNRLVELGYQVEWHEYPMGHQVCLEEVTDIGRWLTRVLTGGASPQNPEPKP